MLTQNKLQEFREEMSKSVDDPFNVTGRRAFGCLRLASGNVAKMGCFELRRAEAVRQRKIYLYI